MNEVPETLRPYSREDVSFQLVPWVADDWVGAFYARPETFEELSNHVASRGGIGRDFIHDYAARTADPIAVFLLAMAWGFANVGYGPHRTSQIVSDPTNLYKIKHIVGETLEHGPVAGWTALISTHKIGGISLSFGTKLLYFAGYRHWYNGRDSIPPLILDNRVRWSLYDLARGAVPPPGSRVYTDHYLNYLHIAQSWAADPSWSQDPDVVEFGLFERNGRYNVPVVIPPELPY